ncbi:MAG: hypothetical protein IJE97_12225 [Thermoguttaceae bacterium]|nr:hypothetical protein [Thermoguttaceae bacterium]
MSKEKERRVDRDDKTCESWLSPSILRRKEATIQAARYSTRQTDYRFSLDYVWTYGKTDCYARGSEYILRLSGVRFGRRIGPNSRYCVWVSPRLGCVRAVLDGVYLAESGIAFFGDVYFIPRQKARRFAVKLLRTPNFRSVEAPQVFVDAPSETRIDLAPFGRVDVY